MRQNTFKPNTITSYSVATDTRMFRLVRLVYECLPKAAAIEALVTVPFPGGARAHTDTHPGSLAGRVVRLNTTQRSTVTPLSTIVPFSLSS